MKADRIPFSALPHGGTLCTTQVFGEMTWARSGHCKNLAPNYELLANAFEHAKDKVIVAKVDADGEGKPLGQKYGVTGFPSE